MSAFSVFLSILLGVLVLGGIAVSLSSKNSLKQRREEHRQIGNGNPGLALILFVPALIVAGYNEVIAGFFPDTSFGEWLKQEHSGYLIVAFAIGAVYLVFLVWRNLQGKGE